MPCRRLAPTNTWALFAFSFVILFAACADSSTTPRLDLEPQLAKPTGGGGGGGKDADPTVNEVDPPVVVQDTTLDLTIIGSNFDAGSLVTFAVDGVPTGKLIANAVRFVNKRTLIATVDVAFDAEVAFHDVIVTTGRGRKGIGTDLLDVQERPLTLMFTDADGDKFTSDGEDIPYTDGVNKTVITVERQLIFDPSDGGKKPADTPRSVCVDLSEQAQDPFGGEKICTQGGFRTTAHSNKDLGLIGMDVGKTIYAQARIIWPDPDAPVEYKILFRCADPDIVFAPCAVTVERTNTTTWVVSFPATEPVALQSRSTRGNNPFVTIGYFFVPFHMVVSQ